MSFKGNHSTLPQKRAINANDWFVRKRSRDVLRCVYYVSDTTCLYREYAAGEGGYQLKSSCSEAAMKRWGDRITERAARELILNLDERDRVLDQEQREFMEGIASLSLRAVSDEELFREARRRGLIP